MGALTKSFGLRLRKARMECGLSQKQLADMVGANVMQICRYERGQVLPALETALALSEALRVSTDVLLAGHDEAASETPRIGDVRLFERFLEAEKLSKTDREAIILLIDGVLAQRTIEAQIDKRRRA